MFGEKFVDNNKKKYKIIYNNKEIELKQFLPIRSMIQN